MKIFTIVCLAVYFALGSCRRSDDHLIIATAANVQFAMKELTREFTLTTNIPCKVIVSSSGQLTARIKEGAPYDLFVSADLKYTRILYEQGLATAPPKVYAHGLLVLWSVARNVTPLPQVLTDSLIRHIAIANPKIAPYGSAAIAVLQHYGMEDKVRSKLVYGESIAQTNQFIISQAANIGFTAKSVVLSPAMKGRGKWYELPQNTYPPIAQAAIVIKRDNSTSSEAAQLFYDFLFSEKAQQILHEYGYLVNEL